MDVASRDGGSGSEFGGIDRLAAGGGTEVEHFAPAAGGESVHGEHGRGRLISDYALRKQRPDKGRDSDKKAADGTRIILVSVRVKELFHRLVGA